MGQRIRQDDVAKDLDAPDLAKWLLEKESVSVPTSTCQTWKSRDWSSSGKILTPGALEDTIGDRLRLEEYTDRFTNEASMEAFVTTLAEGQPQVETTTATLRQW